MDAFTVQSIKPKPDSRAKDGISIRHLVLTQLTAIAHLCNHLVLISRKFWWVFGGWSSRVLARWIFHPPQYHGTDQVASLVSCIIASLHFSFVESFQLFSHSLVLILRKPEPSGTFKYITSIIHQGHVRIEITEQRVLGDIDNPRKWSQRWAGCSISVSTLGYPSSAN